MSICLSCGHQRDSCEICGGDLEDAHVYCDALRSELEQVRGERDEALTKLDEATSFDGIMRQIDTYYPLEVPYFHDSNDPGCVAMRAQRQCLLATQRAEKAEAERDALRAEGVAMRGACLVACNTCREFPDADREHFIPRYPSCVEDGCIVYQALSAPLTDAKGEE